MTETDLTEFRTIALAAVADAAPGKPLDSCTAALIELGVNVSVTSLAQAGMAACMDRALELGASPVQIQEVITLVSGLGVHSLMISAKALADSGRIRGVLPADQQLDSHQTALWKRYVGDDPYWHSFELEFPGFLRALLILSPETFAGFFNYCAIPWTMGTVPALTKELVALACDASPGHRFLPGFKLHLRNALKLGAGAAEILETLEIAARAPEHRGVTSV